MHLVETLPCGCAIMYWRWHDDDPIRIVDDYYRIVPCATHIALRDNIYGWPEPARKAVGELDIALSTVP